MIFLQGGRKNNLKNKVFLYGNGQMKAKYKEQFAIKDIPISEDKKSKADSNNADLSSSSKSKLLNNPDKDSKRIYQPITKPYNQDMVMRTNVTRSRASLSLTGTNVSKTKVIRTPLYNYESFKFVAHIVCIVGPTSIIGRLWPIKSGDNIIIGRSQKSNIIISDVSISKKHLIIRMDQKTNQVFAQDQQSTNGTIIDNKFINAGKEIIVQDNSKIQLGSIILKFLDKGNPEIFSFKKNFNKIFTDSLTGVGNRLLLDSKARELFKSSKVNKTSLSLIIFDIDHFKKVNDTYGHLAGDFILKEVVKIVKACFRSDDLFVRCGGEEFCVMIQGSINRVQEAMEKARQKVEEHSFQYKEKNIKITVSAGITCQQEEDCNWKEIYDRADKLLYKAKASGRNKIFSNM